MVTQWVLDLPSTVTQLAPASAAAVVGGWDYPPAPILLPPKLLMLIAAGIEAAADALVDALSH